MVGSLSTLEEETHGSACGSSKKPKAADGEQGMSHRQNVNPQLCAEAARDTTDRAAGRSAGVHLQWEQGRPQHGGAVAGPLEGLNAPAAHAKTLRALTCSGAAGGCLEGGSIHAERRVAAPAVTSKHNQYREVKMESPKRAAASNKCLVGIAQRGNDEARPCHKGVDASALDMGQSFPDVAIPRGASERPSARHRHLASASKHAQQSASADNFTWVQVDLPAATRGEPSESCQTAATKAMVDIAAHAVCPAAGLQPKSDMRIQEGRIYQPHQNQKSQNGQPVLQEGRPWGNSGQQVCGGGGGSKGPAFSAGDAGGYGRKTSESASADRSQAACSQPIPESWRRLRLAPGKEVPAGSVEGCAAGERHDGARDVYFQLIEALPSSDFAHKNSLTMQLYGVTQEGLSVLVRAGGVMPYFYFRRPRGWPDVAWEALLQIVRQHICKSIDKSCMIETLQRKSLFGEHYEEMLDFARVRLSSAAALDHTLKFVSAPLRDPRLSAAALGLSSKHAEGMSDAGIWLEVYEDNVDITTHFLADYGLQAGGWVCVRHGQFEIQTHDATLEHANDPTGSGKALSTCSLEITCRLALVTEGSGRQRQALRGCHNESGEVGEMSDTGAGSSAAVQASARWERSAPLSLVCLDVAPRVLPVSGSSADGGVAWQEQPALSFISATSMRHGQTKHMQTFLFCVGEVQQVVREGQACVVTKSFKNERSMLMAWQHFLVHELDPDFVVTYESGVLLLLLQRLEALNVSAHRALGRLRSPALPPGAARKPSYSQKAQTSLSGRIVIHLEDMLIKEEQAHKLRSLSLEAVARHFLDCDEVHIRAGDLAEMCEGDVATRSKVGLLVSKRSQLPIRIMLKLEIVVNLIEMSRVTGVLIGGLVNHQQQYKVLTQLSRACKERGYLIPGGRKRSGSKEVAEEGPGGGPKSYKGATVLEPAIGAHSSPICTLDFSSLYPSIMIAHNLSYETLVRGDPARHPLLPPEHRRASAANLPVKQFALDDDEYQELCSADDGRRSAWDGLDLGRPVYWKKGALGAGEGILPCILRRLLLARKQTKDSLKREQDPEMKQILNQRQLAYKVSCNAIYGYTGVLQGVHALPCRVLAATITAIGRQLIAQTQKCIQRHYSIANGFHADASIIYGDTDSVMVDFKLDHHAAAAHRCSDTSCSSTRGGGSGGQCCQISCAMKLGLEAATLVTMSFPEPISLEFEKVYCPYLLFAKKHYAGLMYTNNASKPDKIDVKGIQRRDKCKFVEDTFQACLQGLLNSDLSQRSITPHVEFARSQVDKLLSGKVPVDDLVLGTQLSKGPDDYHKTKTPDHIELAARMAKQGQEYKIGSRILYVRIAGLASKLSVEDPVVALKQGLELDFKWYLEHQLLEPLKHLFSLVMPQASTALFGQGSAPARQIVKRLTSADPTMQRFLAPNRQARCMHCDAVLPARLTKGAIARDETERMCGECAEEMDDLVMAGQSRLIEANLAAKAALKICLACTGEIEQSHQMADMCANVSCSNIYGRALTKTETDEAAQALARLDNATIG